MNIWGRRIRGAIGMGLIWAFTASGVAAVIVRVTTINPDLPLPLLFAPLGFITGILFSALLVIIERRRGFDRMSVSRFAGWGAASGLLLAGIIVAGAALRGAPLLGEFLLFGPALTIAGASFAAGSLALARRAERRQLPATDKNTSALQ
jgi:hypothetical protein